MPLPADLRGHGCWRLAEKHLSSTRTDLGSTPLGNIEKSLRAVNTLATSETDFPIGPPMSLFRTRGMMPALKERSKLIHKD